MIVRTAHHSAVVLTLEVQLHAVQFRHPDLKRMHADKLAEADLAHEVVVAAAIVGGPEEGVPEHGAVSSPLRHIVTACNELDARALTGAGTRTEISCVTPRHVGEASPADVGRCAHAVRTHRVNFVAHGPTQFPAALFREGHWRRRRPRWLRRRLGCVSTTPPAVQESLVLAARDVRVVALHGQFSVGATCLRGPNELVVQFATRIARHHQLHG